MQCTSLRTVGLHSDGKTIAWSPKNYSKEFATFQIPCGKCPSCRLENARQTAVRCVHEAQMHPKNSFITLTYAEENLSSTKLQYKDFQAFVKRLRNYIYDEEIKRLFPRISTQAERREAFASLPSYKDHLEKIKISILATGEYGDKEKRPHWHAIIFNWRPDDLVKKGTNHNGDVVYNSPTLQTLWPYGFSEVGDVSFKSAGYVARYALKKMAHGRDGTHDYEPISRRSSKHAIGKSWLEKHYQDVFNTGRCTLLNGTKVIHSGIPRYYEKWYKKYHPEKWRHYVTQVKAPLIQKAIEKESKISREEKIENFKRAARQGLKVKHQISRTETRRKIVAKRAKDLNKHTKL